MTTDDHIPKPIIPSSTMGNVSFDAAFVVVAASASDWVGLALVAASDVAREEDREDVLVGAAEDVLASGSPSLNMRKV